MKKLIVAAVAAAFLCSPIQAKGIDITQLQFGDAPIDPLEAAKPLMQNILKDPDSASYRLVDVYKGYCRQGWLQGNGVDWAGWAATIEVNAKNSYGGYTGFQPYTILFDGSSPMRAIDGAMFGAYGPAKGLLGLSGGAGVCKTVK